MEERDSDRIPVPRSVREATLAEPRFYVWNRAERVVRPVEEAVRRCLAGRDRAATEPSRLLPPTEASAVYSRP